MLAQTLENISAADLEAAKDWWAKRPMRTSGRSAFAGVYVYEMGIEVPGLAGEPERIVSIEVRSQRQNDCLVALWKICTAIPHPWSRETEGWDNGDGSDPQTAGER